MKTKALRADLSGCRALITGATGDFGRHFAKILCAAGATVICAGRRQPLLTSLTNEIEAAGGKAESVLLDVSSADSIRAAVGGRCNCAVCPK